MGTSVDISNREIARRLERVAELLTSQEANPFRVRAYRSAADSLRRLKEPAAAILEREGEQGLREIEHVGEGLARALSELIRSGHLRVLDRLEGEICPERVLAGVPGIGPKLAERIHDELHIDSLEQLEAAAHDGRLARLPGFGARRLEATQRMLASILGEQRGRPRSDAHERPPVADLLAVDAEYQARAERGELPKIAPRRFNPDASAWLPVLHTTRGGFHYTALFSNTARAHRMGRTHDWVVLFYEREGQQDQCTVVTEHHGGLAGRRVVRGREAECQRHYSRVETR